jgi:AraC-like DNA-binding protein
LLDATRENVDADFRAALQAHAEARTIVLDDRRSYATRVHAYLASRENPGALDMNDVARALGTSARSLRRRLHEEGASWHELMEAARAEVARNLIRGSASIQRVASTLGFADPTAFHHAFKRWTGMTPSEFRQRSLEDG